MSSLTQALIPPAQRQPVEALTDALDLSYGDGFSKRSGFLIMLTLAGTIAIAGVLSDSTATVIGAMIIAPLGTPILGIALGIVTGHLSLVIRSILWVLSGLVIVVALGLVFSLFVATPESLATNSQVVGRTSPSLMDLMAALATGFAGGFAMCRKDLSAVLPGVAIAISLVPPLGVVGVCAGQGLWDDALGALVLFLSNVVALVIAGTIVFTMGGYAREPGSSQTATVLAIVIAVPLAANSIVSIAIARWSVTIQQLATEWLKEQPGARVYNVDWTGLSATLEITTDDGSVPPIDDLRSALSTAIPSYVALSIDVGQGVEHVVQ
jgi:uncharacterized hydrophobic protein (TIGR00271 family)